MCVYVYAYMCVGTHTHTHAHTYNFVHFSVWHSTMAITSDLQTEGEKVEFGDLSNISFSVNLVLYDNFLQIMSWVVLTS